MIPRTATRSGRARTVDPIPVNLSIYETEADGYSVIEKGAILRTHDHELHRGACAGTPVVRGKPSLFALGLKTTIEQVGEHLAAVPAFALFGGLGLYFLTHVALRIRMVGLIRRTTANRPGWIGPGRLVAGIAMLALIPAALELPALDSLGLATGVCCALIAWDVIHYREHRVEVRRART